jgi:triacylglycerol lipase
MDIDNSIDALFKPGISNQYFDIPNPVQISLGEDKFNLWNAWWLAELSRLVYREDKHNLYEENRTTSTDDILKKVGIERIGEIYSDETSTYGLLVKVNVFDISIQNDATCLILAFCGSNELLDWKINIRAYQNRFDELGNVHSGFNKAFRSIKDELLKLPGIKKYPLYVTGHSLGAALATLCVAGLSNKDVNLVACYNYGSPRVGDIKFSNNFKYKNIYRVINHCDIVTTLPFNIPAIQYNHVGAPCFIDADMKLMLSMSIDEIEQYQRSLLLNNLNIMDIPLMLDKIKTGFVEIHSSLTDHAPVNYVAKLEKNLKL